MINLKWLKIIFQRYITASLGGRKSLFIIDGYSSHVNMKFIDLYDSL